MPAQEALQRGKSKEPAFKVSNVGITISTISSRAGRVKQKIGELVLVGLR